MNDDERMGVFVSVSFPILFGIVIGLLIFHPPSQFVMWWKGIDWGAQGVANVGAWVAGIGTSAAAAATAFAAKSSSRAAIAAETSAAQWQERASYEKYIDVGVKARIKLRWMEAHISHMCEKSFNISLSGDFRDKEALYYCLHPDFRFEGDEEDDDYRRFIKYRKNISYQTDKIKGLSEELFNLVEESFELSKSHVGLSSSEKKVIRQIIEEFIGQIEMISRLYHEVFENDELSKDTKLTHIDSCFNCSDSSRHYYFSTKSTLALISSFFDALVIDSNILMWEEAKANYILTKKEILQQIIISGGGEIENHSMEAIEKTFERL